MSNKIKIIDDVINVFSEKYLEVSEEVIQIISEVTGIPTVLIERDNTLEFLEMDSLDVVETKSLIEKKFNIKIGDNVNLRIIDDFIKAVDNGKQNSSMSGVLSK